jgi:hypothetical protein
MTLRKALILRRPQGGRREGRTAPTPGEYWARGEGPSGGSVDPDCGAEGLAD